MVRAAQQMAGKQNATRAAAYYDNMTILGMGRSNQTSCEISSAYFAQPATPGPLSRQEGNNTI
jgi:hypothetical protein